MNRYRQRFNERADSSRHFSRQAHKRRNGEFNELRHAAVQIDPVELQLAAYMRIAVHARVTSPAGNQGKRRDLVACTQ